MWPRRTLGEHFDPFPSPNGAASHARGTFLPHSVAQQHHDARPSDTSARFRSPRVPRRTPGEHFCHYPSPDGALPHARATLTPNSVAQRCRAARPGNISATIRHPTGHYHTLGRHFCPVPSPNSTTTHARATLTSNSVAQRCRAARPGNTSAPFRRLTAPRRTLGEHFRPIPSPNGAASHARGTLKPHSVA